MLAVVQELVSPGRRIMGLQESGKRELWGLEQQLPGERERARQGLLSGKARETSPLVRAGSFVSSFKKGLLGVAHTCIAHRG